MKARGSRICGACCKLFLKERKPEGPWKELQFQDVGRLQLRLRPEQQGQDLGRQEKNLKHKDPAGHASGDQVAEQGIRLTVLRGNYWANLFVNEYSARH